MVFVHIMCHKRECGYFLVTLFRYWLFSMLKERGRFLVKSVKVCVLRLKNSSRTIIFTEYVYFLLKRTIDKFFF